MSPDAERSLVADAAEAASILGNEALEPVITRELLHHDLLRALKEGGHLEGKAFVGGTAVRLAYGGTRLSEDLDFAAGASFDGTEETGIADTLARSVTERYGVATHVREKLRPQSIDRGAVSTWTVLANTRPDRPDVPLVRVKLDISNMASYTPAERPLATHYDAIAPELRDLRIMTQSASEIAADKVVASIATFDRNHPRFRDLVDLTHLAARGDRPDPELVQHKRAEHGDLSSDRDYAGRRDRFLEQLPEMVRDPRFAAEMRQFLPRQSLEAMLGAEAGLDRIEQAVRAQVIEGTQAIGPVAARAPERTIEVPPPEQSPTEHDVSRGRGRDGPEQ